jgi:thiol:disulfide interchange protein DsbC
MEVRLQKEKSDMIKILLVIALVVAFTVPTAFAADDFSAIRTSLQKILQDTPVDGVKATPINGLYEIQSNYDIFYYYPKSDLFFLGQIHDINGKDITREARDKVVEKALASLDLSKAIKSGSGRNVVIEFLDPDCPVCRETAGYWKSKSDVTRYAFLFPAVAEQADALGTSEWILSQKDKSAALDDVLAGKYDKTPSEGITEEGRNLFKEHLRNAEKAYVPGAPFFFVNNKLVLKPDAEAFEAALNDGEQPAEPQADVK